MRLLTLVAITLIASSVAPARGLDSPPYALTVVLQFTPAPVEGNLKGSGAVTVQIDLTSTSDAIQPGTLVPGSESQTFSGNISVKTSIMFRRVGNILTQSSSTGYNSYLNGTYRERIQVIPTSSSGEKAALTESFQLGTPTELGVRPDENLAAYISVKVSLEVLGADGEPAEKNVELKSMSRSVQLYDSAKQNYLDETIQEEEARLRSLDPLKVEGAYDDAPMWNKLIEIKALVDRGNYAEATDRLQLYRKESSQIPSTLAALVAEGQRKSAEYDELAENYQALLTASEILTTENERVIALLQNTANLLTRSQKDYEELRARYATLVPVAAGSAILIGLLIGYTWGRRSKPSLV